MTIEQADRILQECEDFEMELIFREFDELAERVDALDREEMTARQVSLAR